MEQIYSYNGNPIKMEDMQFLTDKGSEFLAYKYLDMVLKLYKKDYKLSHLSKEELLTLTKINTKRILMPTDLLKNISEEIIGYSMPYIGGVKSLICEQTGHFFEELEVVDEDIITLSNNNIILRDINPSNIIYNGKLFLIDPGNYLINEIEKIIFHIDISILSLEKRRELIRKWNYNKLNTLIELLLFTKNKNIDLLKYRWAVNFFKKIRDEEKIQYNLIILKRYLNSNMTLLDAVNKFIDNNYQEDPEEKKFFSSLSF